MPPSFDGHSRHPVPRFTVLDEDDKARLGAFFAALADVLWPALVPGAHLFIAANPLLSHLVYAPLIDRGFEKRVARSTAAQPLARVQGEQAALGAAIALQPPWLVHRMALSGRSDGDHRTWEAGGRLAS